MNGTKRAIRKILPPAVINMAGATYDWFGRLKDLPSAYFHPWRRQSIRGLQNFRDIHRGKRCFILGNGPSLAKTDLSHLRDEYTMGLNRI